MKKIISFIVVGVLLVTTSVMVFADTPTEVLEGLTDLTFEEIYEARKNDVRLGDLAREYGVYSEFSEKFLEEKLAILEEKLSAGELSQEDYNFLTKQLEDCDGTGTMQVLKDVGMQFGRRANGGFARNADTKGMGYNRTTNGNGNGFGRNN